MNRPGNPGAFWCESRRWRERGQLPMAGGPRLRPAGWRRSARATFFGCTQSNHWKRGQFDRPANFSTTVDESPRALYKPLIVSGHRAVV